MKAGYFIPRQRVIAGTRFLLLWLSICPFTPASMGYSPLFVPGAAGGKTDRSIVTEKSGVDPLVENGDAYEKSSFVLPTYVHKISVPPRTVVIHSPQEAGRMEILLVKSMGFAGHPGMFVSIRSERKRMGAAVKIEGRDLVFALFGGFDSCIEGGTSIDAVIIVPQNLRVTKKRRLQFEDVASDRWKGSEHFKRQDWFILPTYPDPEHRFNAYRRRTD
jgi:hypothetical protein